ncbi:MAG: InlB B-repeat-containing protein [Paludibacteraceae bacterium]|nr:InlB B-repeat-containing protein [Paludibacteraceae bacterium]
MSKKILFMSCAKLTALSIGLLLAVFCTIGMSFTPGEEGDNVGNPNDSTYITGPRRSHWNGGGCNESDSNNNDYARTSVVTMGHGTVSIKNTTKNGSLTSTTTKTSTNADGNEAVITWNCNKSTSGHTNSFELTATPDYGYYFAGWSTSNTSNTASSTENPWTIPVTIPHGEKGTSQNTDWESSSNPYPTTYYGYFALITYVDVTFAPAPEGCSYDITVGGNTQTVTTSNVVKTHITEAKLSNPVASSGYVFAGWYQIDGSGNVVDITSESPTVKFSEDVTLGARFVSTSAPKFKNITKNVEYYGLRLAISAASANDVIIPVADCTVDGSDLVAGESYTIPAGVTLLIPYNNDNTVATTLPAKENYSGGSAPSPYRKLALGEGVKIIVAGGGAISVASEFYGPATYNTAAEYKAGVRGPHGFIYMNSDSEIILNNGANLYAWGYITGDGEITAQNGSTVYEMMQMTDYRGGSATSDFTSGGVFPFSQYYIQNIESALHLESGATEYVRAAVTMSSAPYPATAKLIGASGALFNISSGVLTKKYDRLSDRLLITMNGNGSLASMALKFTGLPLIGSIDLNTGDYVLPLNSNMRIEVASGKTLTLSQDLAVLPGVEVHISTGAKLLISSGYIMYAYDMAEWVGKGYVFPSLDIKPLNYVARNHVDVSGAPRSRSLANAKIIVDGGIEATGSFFTTESGADICSTLGSNGYIKLVSKAPTNTNTQQATQSGTNVTRKNIPVTSAQLHNEDGYYTTTSGAPANTTINYKHGHWGWRVIWKLEDGTELKRAYYYKQPDATWISSNKPAETHPNEGTSSCTYTFNGWNQETISAQQEIEITADFTKTCPNYYEVVWKSEDGSLTLETDASVGEGEATHYNGEALTKATNWTTYTEYEFDGWATEANGAKVYDDGATPAATADVTYYAHFKSIGMAASVTVSGQEPEIYKTLPEAFDAANTKANCTIKILNEVSGITSRLVYDRPNGVCTLDLNNHTVSGAVPYTDKNNIGGLIVINASGSTFAITDNSDEKNGRIENIKAQNQVTYGVLVTAGTLDVDTGTVYVENPAQYASKAATVNEVAVTKLDACGARAVQVSAGQTFNFKKGLLEAHATRNAYGIVATGNTANTTQVTITGGKVYAEAPCGAYGISCTGKLDMSAGLVEAKLNDHLVDASYTATDASNNLNKHQSCYGIIMNGYANATASSCYFGTLTITGGKIKASSDLVRSYTSNVYGIYMNVSVAGMGNRNNASTSKTNSEQACSKGSIKNATIEVQNNGNYGYGIIVLGKYNSKDKSNTTIQVENTNVTVKANNYAYGIYASGAINGTTGECSSSDVELTNCTVWAEAEKAAGAYATWVWAGYTTIYQDKQANYYGEYAAGAKMTINSGTYTAKTKTTSAYATGTSLRAKSIYDPTSSTTWGPGEGKEAKATLIIKGGTFLGEATTTTARAVSNGGDCTITGGNFTAIAGTTTAYGLYCQSGKLTATGVPITVYAKGRASSSDNNAYAYGAMADVSIIGSGNQAWTGYACAGEIELNNCTINDTATTYANARGVMVNASSVMLTRANFDKQKTTSSWSTATYNQYNSVFPVQVQGKDSIWVGIAAKATINGGTINVTAHTTTAYGAFVNRALKYSYTKPNTILDEYQGQLEINNATFVVKTETSTTAEGVRAYGPTTITGGSFTVQPSGATAYGLKVYAGKTTVNGNPTFNVKATTTAYGIMAGGGEAPHTKLGYGYDGEVEVNGGTFNVETTADKPAYGVLVYANSTPITSTAAGYYAGNYASAGKATINDGVFNVKSKKTEAYGIYMSPAVSQSGATGYETATATPICEVNGGTFTAEGTTDIAYGAYVSNGVTLKVTDGAFKGKLTAVGAEKYAVGAYIAAGGILNATGGAFEAEAAKSGLSSKQKAYACGLYTPDGAATISASNATFKGELKSNYLTSTTTDATSWSGGAYGVYARTTNPLSLTNCTITGNSAYQGGFGLRFANTPAEVRNCNITVTTTKAYNYGLFVGGADSDVKLYDCNFTCTSGTTYAYGIYAYNGATYAEDCEINAIVQRTGATSAADSYLYGVLVAAGKTATLKDCSITATGSGKYSNNGYGVYVDGTANLDNCDVAVSNINSNAYALFNTANTTLLNVISGKYKATATSGAASTNGTAAAAKQTLNGGYYSHNTNLAKYTVSPKKVLTLRESHTLYPDYKYTINEGGTVTWKNGTKTLLSEDYLKGETPAYTSTPTKDADAQYTYTFDGWSTTDGGDKLPSLPAVSADATYFAHYSKTEKKYTVNVSAGEHGSVSPASVSDIGCVTASGDITATPNTGYRFANWTLPTSVTAADGYTSESNPIHIHATASGKTITANFAAKTYTVTLDNQSATTPGAASVTATYNEAMPSIAANLPAKTGYAFGGYFSETNGGGMQYYNADGTSAHIWDVDAVSPTLYAKWTSSVVETGPVLDIVDATNDGANGTLTLNATSWPNSAAGYYINEVLYTRLANRTIVIDYTGKKPGDPFVIDVKKSGAVDSYSCHSYTIPRVITSNTAITEDQNWPIFVKGATLTVDNDIATGKIYVGADAKLVINEALTADGIYLRTTPTAAAQMLNNGTINAQLYYTRIIDSKANYYPFGLPLDCDIEDVAMSDGSARPKYGSGWLLRWYDESSRAANGGATNNMTSKEGDPAVFPTKIVGGRGYEMFSASNYYREFYFPIDHSQLKSTVPVSYTENGAAGEKHAGWNVLVSPWTWTHNQISQPENITVCWLEGNTWGEQDNPDVIPPSKLFAYQASSGQSIVSFAGTNIAAARRRVAAAEEPTRIQWIRLDVKDANGVGDQTSIYSHPTRYEQTYKTGIDVAKQALTSTHAILYSSHAYGDMAFAGVADAQLEQGVPLTVYSPSAQELTISMRDNDWLNRMEYVWLIDVETGMQINLLNSDYTFDAAEGTTRGRFFIRGQFKAPNITTDIQNGAGIEEGARKVLIDQKIYIEVNGRLYDATGKIVSK